jgi:hypothetical protein
MFRWVQDHEGDIGLRLFWGLLTVIKYKQSALVHWFARFPPADKYQGSDGSERRRLKPA